MGSVLIVESYLTLSSFYKTILEEDGHKVFVALTGKEAIQIASEQQIDVVVIEDRLPDFDTEELLKELKVLQPHIEATICTSTELFARAQDDLCKENIQKSPDFTILQEKVNKLLQRSVKTNSSVL